MKKKKQEKNDLTDHITNCKLVYQTGKLVAFQYSSQFGINIISLFIQLAKPSKRLNFNVGNLYQNLIPPPDSKTYFTDSNNQFY